MYDSSSSTPLSTLADALREAGLNPALNGSDVPVFGCACDSRDVTEHNLFVCKGAAFSPRFLTAARQAGAESYLCSASAAAALAEVEPSMPALVLPDDELRAAMAHASRLAWHEPDLALPVFGITGTKGKSSAVYLARAVLKQHHPVGIMGSIDTYDGIEDFESHNTTPEAPELWRHLAHACDAGLSGTVMEVSSQALKYDRTLGLRFAAGAFLNIGRDHISPVEHPDFEDYFASKLRLFAQSRVGIVNLGTERLADVVAAAQACEQVLYLSAKGGDAVDGIAPTHWASNVRSGGGRVRFVCHTPSWEGELELGMPGLFNVENALVAVAIAQLAGASYNDIAEGLPQARVPGRMELIGSDEDHVMALVDYAHNKLSYQKLFASLAEEFPGRRLTAVFGAPGGKAQERRRELPEEAARWVSKMFLTEEDPAHESAADICEEMASHVPAGAEYVVEPNRTQAIYQAVDDALASEQPTLVCLLAKGDETRQHVGDEYPPMTPDGEVFKQAIAG